MNRSISMVAISVCLSMLASGAEASSAATTSDFDIVQFPKKNVGSFSFTLNGETIRGTAQGNAKIPKGTPLDVQVSDEGITDLNWLLRLSHPVAFLSLRSTDATDKVCEVLPQMKELKHLDIENTSIGDACINKIAKLPKLTELAMANTMVTDAGLKALGESKTIDTITLQRTNISTRGIRYLRGLKLRFLDLRDTPVDDASAEVLAGVPTLGILKLNHTRITDAGVKKLTTLKHLQDLGINGLPITDKAIPSLSQMKQLKRLDIRDTDISRNGIKRLHQALPTTELRNGLWQW